MKGSNVMGYSVSIAVSVMLLTLSACGARTKSAGDVKSLFGQASATLGDKMLGICESLRNRSTSPNLKDLELSNKDCSAAGREAQNYKDIESFTFSNINAASITGQHGEDVINLSSRSQVWLNKSVIGLASAVASALSAMTTKANGPIGNQASAFGGKLVQAKITMVQKLSFDHATKEFTGKLNFHLDGAVTVDNDIKISGKIFSDMIVARIDTTSDRAYKDSLFKNLRAIAIIVPFASDVYVDLVLQLSVHSIGADDVIAPPLKLALSSGMKSLLDGLINL